MRYRFKGIIRTTGQSVEGHAHGDTPEEAYAALSEHGIVTESLREEPEMVAGAAAGAQNQPLSSAIDSALDTAASQVPFDAIANRYKGKSVWVIDREKIRNRVAQVVDTALREALSSQPTTAAIDGADLRKQVADAIGGLFKDNRNITSQVSDTSLKMDHQIRRIEQMVLRAESVLAQMTIAISRMGSGGYGGGGGGPRRFVTSGAGARSEQNTVLLEIFKENLRLRGIEIDEPAEEPQSGSPGPAASTPAPSSDAPAAPSGGPRMERPASPLSAAPAPSSSQTNQVEPE